MARAHLAHVVVDQDGDVQANKTVQVFEASDGTTPYASSIYAAVTGGVPLVSMATDSLGLIELFTDEADARRAKLTIQGVAAQTLTDFYPDAGEIVTRGKVQTLTNKTLTAPTITNPTSSTGTFTSPTIVNPAISTTTSTTWDLTGTRINLTYSGVLFGTIWGSSGVAPGGISLNTGITLRDDGVPGNVYGQNTPPLMLHIQRDVDTVTSPVGPLANFSYSSQSTGPADNACVSIARRQTAGGVDCSATVRALDVEAFLYKDVGTEYATPVVGWEAGIHLGARTPFYMPADVDGWFYAFGNPHTQTEGPRNKVVSYLSANSEGWRSQMGMSASDKIPRHGVAYMADGPNGWDYFDVRGDENDEYVYTLNGHGRARYKPAMFAKVWRDDAGVYTNQSAHASTSRANSSTLVQLPTGNNDRVYIGLSAPFSHVYVQVSTPNSYAAGAGTLVAEYLTAAGTWTSISANQPANGSVLTDGTRATSAGGQPGPFVQSGAITFAPPTNWWFGVPTVLSGTDNTSRYWIRFGVSVTASTTAGKADSVRPGTVNSFEVFAGSADTVVALDVTVAGDTEVNGRLVYSDYLVHASAKTQTKSANYTMTAADSGYVTYVDTDAFTITLPDCTTMPAGTTYTFVNAGVDAAVLITISPNAADMIQGVGLTGANDKDILNTKATAKHGDLVTIVNDKVDGWVVSRMHGTWARQA
jgi:hypothetical protein